MPTETEKEKATERVIRAWLVPGRVPEYHWKQQEKLRRDWPMLARALDNLARVEPKGAS